MKILTLCLCAAVVVAPARPAAADEAVVGVAVGLGTTLAVVNTVATVVYAVEGRSFDVGWMISSCLSSAVAGGASVLVFSEASSGGGGLAAFGGLVLLALAGVPLGWATRSALSEVDLGERFEPPRARAEPAMSFAIPVLSF